MMDTSMTQNPAIDAYPLGPVIEELVEQTKQLYQADSIPWVIGYSGGKDSTATLQLVWMALAELSPGQRTKPVHVISTDTLVENPVVAAWVSKSLIIMRRAAKKECLPIYPHRLTPTTQDSFWVNLIGRGYPAPRHKFRWCTERLKIKPSNKFIVDIVQENGECILVLGTRKSESTNRSSRMRKLEGERTRDLLSPNHSLPNSFVYTPIENWSNDAVWQFLLDFENPWGYRNNDLLAMYRGATKDAECPLVVDTSTPSCGDSRFGCWVCTLVEQDRSMAAMIQNDSEKQWMQPLLDLRNELDLTDDRHLRDFRRMAGHVQLYNDRAIPGPYTQESREHWLRKLLQAQRWIRENGPEHVRDLELISEVELQEIRRIWVMDKHELEDSLPRIYDEALGQPYAGADIVNHHAFGQDEMRILREICDGDELHFQLVRELLDVEASFRTHSKRRGLFDALESAFKRNAYTGIEDATALARERRDALKAAREGINAQLDLTLTGGDSSPVP